MVHDCIFKVEYLSKNILVIKNAMSLKSICVKADYITVLVM